MTTGWDHVVTRLQQARHDAGDPSYGEIVQRVVAVRVERGESPESARVARSTVYDCFRPGRSRLSAPLVRDIGLALGVPEDDVDRWIAERDRPPEPEPEPEPGPEPVLVDHDPPVARPTPPAAPTRGTVVVLLVTGVLVNLAGIQLQVALDLPLHLDKTISLNAVRWFSIEVSLSTD